MHVRNVGPDRTTGVDACDFSVELMTEADGHRAGMPVPPTRA